MSEEINQREFSVFKSFPNLEMANELAQIFIETGIKTRVVDNSAELEIILANGQNLDAFQVVIPKEEFALAHKLMEGTGAFSEEEFDNEYYLYDFTDEELWDIIKKFDEWSEFDVKLSIDILKSRGASIDESMVKSMKEERISQLSVAENLEFGLIILAYAAAFFVPIAGILVGRYLKLYRKTLPTGEKIAHYDEDTRNHGKNILYIGIVCIIIWVATLTYVAMFAK